MNFDLNEEQELFRASVERFCGDGDGSARRALRASGAGYERSRWRRLAELGLVAMPVASDHAGLDGTPMDLALVGEALGRVIAPDPWLENGVLPARLLEMAGRQDVLASVMSGERFIAVAFAERAARYSLVPVQTRARAGAGGYSLSGEKTFVLGGALADACIVSATLDGKTAMFFVPCDRPGLELQSYRVVDGSHACEIRLADVEVPEGARLDLDPASLDAVVAEARLLAASEMLGLSQRLFDDTLAYVKQREQFGVPIGTFQALQHRLVDCYSRLEQSRSMLYRAALQDRTDRAAWRRAAAGAKTFIGENAMHIAREAVQMHGGMGITDELAIGSAMKRVLLLGALFGDSDTTLVEYAVAA